MTENTIRDSLGWAIARTAMAHRASAARLLGQVGLHPGQEFLLEALWHEDGQRVSVLADRLSIEPPTATRMVCRLEAGGFVHRGSDPADGRATLVWLTDKGRDARHEVRRLLVELEGETCRGLTVDERVELRRLLDRVRDRLGGAAPFDC